MHSETQQSTRTRSTSPQKARTPRQRWHHIALTATSALAIAGLVTGAGFHAQASQDAEARVAATESFSDSSGRQHDQLAAYDEISKSRIQDGASTTLAEANRVLVAAQDKVDSSTLSQQVSSLAGYTMMPLDDVASLTAATKVEAASVETAAVEADRVAAEAAAQAAAEAAAAAAAQAAEEASAAAAAAEAQRATAAASSNTVNGARAVAQAMAASKYGWGADQFSCLDNLWQKESNWNFAAVNKSSGATGIPQSLPASKMASAGADYLTNATTQISWGLQYINDSRYGTPCAAWSHSQSNNWY